MASLARYLDSLRLGDGQPDMKARKQELSNLIQTLSGSEVRYLQARINAIDFRMDICACLPIEILLQIFSFLDLEDAMRARSISRQWQKIFSSPDFYIGITKQQFFSTWDRRYKSADPGSQMNFKANLCKWLPNAASKRIKRLRGQYSEISAYPYPSFTNIGMNGDFESAQLCNGRIAHKVDSETILVKDLRSHWTKLFMDENRVSLSPRWALSDAFLVASKSHPFQLLAWSLDIHHESPNIIRLPNSVAYLYAYKDKVGIVTSTNEVMIWNIGGEILSLDLSVVPSPVKHIMVHLHPDNQKHIYVTSIIDLESPEEDDGHDKPVTEIYVQEFEGGKPETLHHFEMAARWDSTYHIPPFASMEDGSFGIILQDSFDYPRGPMGAIRSRNTPFSDPCKHIKPDEGKPLFSKILIVVKFDIHARCFTTSSYHLPTPRVLPMPPRIVNGSIDEERSATLQFHEALFWRGQAIIPTQNNDWHGTTEAMLAAGLEDCSSISPQRHNTPWYGQDESQNQKLWHVPEDPVLAECGVSFCWLDREDKTPAGQPLSEDRRVVRGDDDFVVLFGRFGYVVWCFDESVKLPRDSSTVPPFTNCLFPSPNSEVTIYSLAIPHPSIRAN
ncbi:hypothetical protein G7Y89_g8501 [Cudoniella acicularis]|uniref:F-box domain-containing protein n=1 Tax=Cudoniella acicularis TaxID=354080 RepID=A0A8H4RGI3_9HELO|nr:hypothetical protein G7Y89_g8501 [Cudoniella acicularis]